MNSPRHHLPRPRRTLRSLVLLAAAAPCVAAAQEAPEPLRIGEHTFHRRVLANGLRALAVQDADERVSVFVVIGAGKRQETPETTGLAHLVEHAMYTGTERTGAGGHDRRIAELGGESNAFTREDTTLFYDHDLPAQALDEVLAMEADRLRGLRFDEAAVLHERERLRLEEQATHRAASARAERLEAVVFRVHPYGAGVPDATGHTRAPSLGLPAVREFYDTYYLPGNAAVVVVGALPPERALDAIERAFGPLPAGPTPPAVPTEPEVSEPRGHTLSSGLGRDRVHKVWLVPALGHPDRPLLDVLARLLARRTSADGAPIEAEAGPRVDREIFSVAATGEDAEAELERLLAEVRAEAPDPQAVREVVALLRDDVSGLPLRARPYFSLAAVVGVHAVLDRLEHLARYEERVDAVRPEDLLRVARTYLAPERCVTVRFRGTGEEPAPLPEDPQALHAVAEDATEAGDLERAIEAYSKLLTKDPNRMTKVICLASRGQVRMQQKDYEGAIVDFELALAVVDYPAVRDLLQEARDLLQGEALRAGASASAAPPPAPAEPTGGTGPAEDTRPEEAAPDDDAVVRADLRARLEAARTELTDWRGLAFRAPVEPDFVTEADEKLGGWYEPDTKRMVVVTGKGVRFSRGTLLHELQHALQDQHFDLGRLHDEATGPDAARALDGLIEGEAMLAVSELMNYDFESHAVLPATGELERERFEKIFQYGAGLRFVRALRERGGWEAVDAAFRAPPRTSGEVLHPERYPAPEPARLADLAVEGEALVDERRGAFEVLWLLARAEGSRAAADELAGDLEADRFRRVERAGGELREHWDLRFASEEVARRFAELAELGADGWTLTRAGRDVRLVRTP